MYFKVLPLINLQDFKIKTCYRLSKIFSVRYFIIWLNLSVLTDPNKRYEVIITLQFNLINLLMFFTKNGNSTDKY